MENSLVVLHLNIECYGEFFSGITSGMWNGNVYFRNLLKPVPTSGAKEISRFSEVPLYVKMVIDVLMY